MLSFPSNRRLLARSVMTVCCLSLLLPAAWAADLRDAAPPDAYLAAWAKHNPERDFLKTHYQNVWKTVQDTRLVERILQLAQSRVGAGDAQQFLAVRDALTSALAPVQWEQLAQTSELLYAQRIRFPAAQQLLLVRIPEGGAAALHAAAGNLFRLAEQSANGKIQLTEETVDGFALLTLQLGPEVPLQPIVGVRDDLFVFSSSTEMLRESLQLLADPAANSRFDDPRLLDSLQQLPAAEDAIAFVDLQAMTQQIGGIGNFLRQAANQQPQVVRLASFIEKLVEQMSAFDCVTTVEYTDGYQLRTASFGMLRSDAGDKVLGRMVQQQQPFEDWKRWVPDSASGFSLNSGLTLEPLYTWLLTEVPATFPEVQPHLDRFAALQQQHDLYLNDDLLQAFGGEMASITFPGRTPTPLGKSSESVLFLRCTKPDRIRELLHRGMNALTEHPEVQAQGLGLKEVPELEGFEELTANVLGMAGVRPVIGFHNGWLVIGSHPAAVSRALATQAGEGASFAETDTFRQFALSADGPVYAISYSNTGETTRQIANALQQAGMLVPVFIGMAGQQQPGGPDLTVVQDAAALLPAIGRIVARCDFLDQQMSVAQPGPRPGTWIAHRVVLVRPPAAEQPAEVEQPESRTRDSKSEK